MLPDVLKNIFHSSSAMGKISIENNGKTLDDRVKAGKKVKHENILL